MSNPVIGSSRYYFSTLTSTNRFATRLLSKTRPRAGTVISAEFQTRGEGQYGRSWFGTKGKNLYLSLILYPRVLPAEQFRISAYAALAVRETVDAICGRSASIKWPNDVYVDDHKVAGILIKNTISGQQIQNSVIGIGININENAFPIDIPNPSSIGQISGKTLSVRTTRELLIDNLNDLYKSTMQSDMRFVIKAYNGHLYRNGENIQYELTDDGSLLGGMICGVDTFGRLEIKQADIVQAYALNEIRLMK